MDVEKNLEMYFKHQISTIPKEIDLQNMRIEDMKSPKRHNMTIKFALVMILLLSMTGTSIVYADSIVSYIKNMSFLQSDGDIAWSIDTEKESGSYNEIVDATYEQLNLTPGQAVAIYAVENNPNKVIVSLQEPLVIQDINELNSYQINSFDYGFLAQLLQKYDFSEGKVTLETILTNDYKDLMLEEAEVTGDSVIVKEIEVSSEVQSVVLEYSSREQLEESPAFTVQIMKWFGDKVIETGDEDGKATSNYEKIMLDEFEVLYSELFGRREVTWVASGIYYNISTIEETMSKDELIQISKELARGYEE